MKYHVPPPPFPPKSWRTDGGEDLVGEGVGVAGKGVGGVEHLGQGLASRPSEERTPATDQTVGRIFHDPHLGGARAVPLAEREGDVLPPPPIWQRVWSELLASRCEFLRPMRRMESFSTSMGDWSGGPPPPPPGPCYDSNTTLTPPPSLSALRKALGWSFATATLVPPP